MTVDQLLRELEGPDVPESAPDPVTQALTEQGFSPCDIERLERYRAAIQRGVFSDFIREVRLS